MRDDASPQSPIGRLLGSALKAFRDDLYERVDAAGRPSASSSTDREA
jgi:hypothetical protein